jgi:hypothetical protein
MSVDVIVECSLYKLATTFKYCGPTWFYSDYSVIPYTQLFLISGSKFNINSVIPHIHPVIVTRRTQLLFVQGHSYSLLLAKLISICK